MPDVIIKDQNNQVKNYPENLKDADMTGIDSITRKNELIKSWSEING